MLASFVNLLRVNKPNLSNVCGGPLTVGVREYAARKGTRERKAKLKKKRKEEKVVETKKKVFGARKDLVYVKQRPFDDSHYPAAVDDVFFHRKFQTLEYSFKDAVQFHREIHHETVYNKPEAPLWFRVDIDLVYPNRPNKFQDPWKSIVELREPFLLEGMKKPSVIAFCEENADQISEAIKAGAEKAGGKELIAAVQKGDVKPADYDYVVAHPLVVTELTALRGLMRRNFPSIKTKTVGTDIEKMIMSLQKCMKFNVQHSDQEPDFGYVVACLGFLNMPLDGLEGNFEAYLKDIVNRRVAGKDPSQFILKVQAYTDYSFEKFKIDWKQYI